MLVNLEEAKREVEEIQLFLAIREEQDANRRRKLWKSWHEKVFDPIQERIQENITRDKVQELHDKRYGLSVML
jgi:hypothetical protein